MKNLRTQIDNNGRMLIPSTIRKQYNIKPGDIYVLRMIDDEMHFINLDKVIKQAQNLFRKYVPENSSKINVVEDFLLEKRKEANLEALRFNRNSEDLSIND
jgi:AbrB family looped-hinge helix DNA binding protein